MDCVLAPWRLCVRFLSMPPIYDKLAQVYDFAFAPFEKRFLAKWRAETLAFLPDDAMILEIGAGTGANFPFYPKTRVAVSSEISIKMLDFAGKRPEAKNLVQSDAQALPFGENTFDAAFATLVFCSIPNPETAFEELRTVVKPGGRIVLLEHVRPPGRLGRVFDILNYLTVALIDDHFNRRTAEIAERCGLKLTHVSVKAAGAVNLIVCEVVK